MQKENFYGVAITNFSEAIAAMEPSAQYSNKPMWILLHGLWHLARGLLQSEQATEQRLSAIEELLKLRG